MPDGIKKLGMVYVVRVVPMFVNSGERAQTALELAKCESQFAN